MDNEERLRRIAVLSRRLRWAIWTVPVLALVAILITVAGAEWPVQAKLALGEREIPMHDLSFAHRVLAVLAFTPFFVVCGCLLWACDRLLRLYEEGTIFAVENAALIRRSGQLVILLGVMQSVAGPVGSMVLGAVGVLGPQHEVIFDPDVGLILVGAGIIVVGHVMSLGAALAEESALTI